VVLFPHTIILPMGGHKKGLTLRKKYLTTLKL